MKRVALISVALATGAALSLAALVMHSKPVAPVAAEPDLLTIQYDAERALAVKRMRIRAAMESSERMLLATVEIQCAGRAQPAGCADGVPVHARRRQILPMPAAEERFDEYAALRARSRAESAVWIDRWSRGDLK